MSWLIKAENILNKLDQSAANVLKNAEQDPLIQPKNEEPPTGGGIRKIPSKNNILVLKNSTPKKKKSVIDPEEKILDILNNECETKSQKSQKYSDRQSDASSVISRHDTVVIVDKADDQGSVNSNSQSQSKSVLMSSSTTSLQNFSAEKELAATKMVLSELKAERDELKAELEICMEQTKNNNSQLKITELEDLCNQLIEEKENLVKISQTLETSNINYIKSISELESTISKHLQNENELKQKLDYSKNETTAAMSELAQYRSRAQSTLQMKEKIIEQLRNGQQENSSRTERDVIESTLSIELEQLKTERQNLQLEIKSLTTRYEDSRKFIENLEKRHSLEIEEMLEKLKNLDEQVHQGNLKSSHYEDEIKSLKQEITIVRDERTKEKTLLTVQLHEKETELTKLKTSALNRPLSSSNELENRIQTLTQSLITKQTALENLTAERNAIRLQMEKLSHKHEETLMQMSVHNRPQITNQTLINMNETDDAKSQVPNFMMENPFDTRISRRVKRAYSSLDSVGIRLSVFLRRNPLLRIVSICYIAFLHLWVMFILLSSTPSPR